MSSTWSRWRCCRCRSGSAPEAAAAALEGTDLDYSQREACLGLLTSGRLINCLVAPAGTGKTHVMAAFARAWDGQRAGRVIGLTASTNAARVMADEAARAGAPMETFNIAQFLGKIKDSDETRGHVPVYPGDVLVVDEATQGRTEDALRIAQIARRNGAMVIGTFDPEQLGAVDAGGHLPADRRAARVLPAHRGPPVHQRMGAGRLAEAAGGGRHRAWPSTQAAAGSTTGRRTGYSMTRCRPVPERLPGRQGSPAHGHVERDRGPAVRPGARTAGRVAPRQREAEITLADGNQAGRGDLIRARLNTRIDADGQTLANRDVVRVESINDSAYGQLAAVVRQTGPDQWSRPVLRAGGVPRERRRAGLRGQRPRRPGPHRRAGAPGGRQRR